MDIICRFDNERDFKSLVAKLSPTLNIKTEIYDLDNLGDIKRYINTTKTKVIRDVESEFPYWVEMPEFKSMKIEPFHKCIFRTSKTLDELSEIFEQNITTQTKSIWFPKLKEAPLRGYRALGSSIKPKYPIYVVSKNRSDNCATSKFLSNMHQEHFVVVEKFDVVKYQNTVGKSEYCTILELDPKYQEEYDVFSDLGATNSTGPGAARNFCWDDSISRGYDWHWVMDDNTKEGC